MRDASSSASSSAASTREAEAPAASAPHAQLPDGPEAEGPPDAREQHVLLQKLHRAAPELNHYHVLLIPKDVDESTESDVSGSVRPPRCREHLVQVLLPRVLAKVSMLMLMLFHGCAVYSAVVPDSPAALAPALPPGWTGAAGVYYTISSGNCAVPVSTRESCEAAAAVLGLSSDDTESYSYYANQEKADSPPFCVSHFDNDEWLTFAPGNTGTCTPEE
eukprot:scaffold49037_cov91-Phaeocystis_antarctica.AAC.1